MKKTSTILFIVGLGIFFFTGLSNAGWLIFHKPAYTGKVIDAENREPIEGAVIVVVYGTTNYIGGPSGPLSRKIHAQETLTDRKGEFRIPSYTTLMGPISKEDRTDFIIYKPGYGRYPIGRPPDLVIVGPDAYFTKEIGIKGEVYWGKKTKSFTYGIVKLRSLSTWKERDKANSISRRDFKLPILYEMIDKEDEWQRNNKGWRK